jgi:hypothetical protein
MGGSARQWFLRLLFLYHFFGVQVLGLERRLVSGDIGFRLAAAMARERLTRKQAAAVPLNRALDQCGGLEGAGRAGGERSLGFRLWSFGRGFAAIF